MEGFVIFLMFAVGLGLGIWINYFIAGEMNKIAELKGHYQKKYFWICFLLGIAGYCLIIALPDRGTNKAATFDNLPKL